MTRNKRVMVLSPHADDAEIGCGGYMARTIAEGGQVLVSVATVSPVHFLHLGRSVSAEERIEELRASMGVLGASFQVLTQGRDGCMAQYSQGEMVKLLDDSMEEFKPDVVLIPLPSSHQDHRYCWEVGIATCRPSPSKHQPCMIAAYEYPSTSWGDGAEANAGRGGIYMDVSAYWDTKVASLMKYETQMRAKGHLFSIDGCEALARLRGLEAGFQYAELFHALRIRL